LNVFFFFFSFYLDIIAAIRSILFVLLHETAVKIGVFSFPGLKAFAKQMERKKHSRGR
jgi:hypothetical protein